MPKNRWIFAYAIGILGLLPALASGQAGSGAGSNPQPATAVLAQPIAVDVPSVNGLATKGAYWFWIALFGFAGLVCVSCFKHPKRSHNT